MADESRRLFLLFQRDLRRELWRWSYQCAIPFRVLQKLELLYREEQHIFAALLCLLRTKKFKSDFRASLAVQVRGWCLSEESQERFRYPLSRRQLSSCTHKGVQSILTELPRFIAQERHLKRKEGY